MLKRGLMLAFLFVVTLMMTSQWSSSQDSEEQGAIPAYNARPPAKGTKLPPILPKEQTHAYELASKIPVVLHQQPCYCYCDRMGHNSLHSCFENTHGAQCATCLKELYYSYSMTQKHKTAAQIRQGIIKGEWRQVNLKSAAATN